MCVDSGRSHRVNSESATGPIRISYDSAVEEGQAFFEDSVRLMMPDLLAYFIRRVLPREDAADCLSETMLVLWRKRRALPGTKTDQRAWAFGIAKRVLANQRRGSIRRQALGERIRAEICEHPPADGLETDLLASLPAKDGELVRLIVWDGFGIAEAGALLGLKPSAARMRFGRAKDKLRELLA